MTLGKFPIRNNVGSTFFIKNGSDPKYDWKGWVPFEDNPHIKNPKKGYIIATNNGVRGEVINI